ncbi:MAG: hypothetical protein IRZ11_02070 [Clostridia bacterium]|nr:hypothetical protein [Clostridia bacterium]
MKRRSRDEGARKTAGEWVAAVDLGTTKALALVARRTAGGWRLAGLGRAPARGVGRGAVTDPEAAGRALADALDRAVAGLGLARPGEGRAGLPPLWLNVAGEAVYDEPARAEVAVARGRVREEDVLALRELLTAACGLERAAVGLFDERFLAAPGRPLPEPVGKPAARLLGEARVVSCPGPLALALRSAAAAAGCEVAQIVPAGVASAWAVLDGEERREGAVALDFGAGTIDLAVFRDGEPVRAASLPLGSQYITNDLALGLGIPWMAAEALKCRHARVDGALVQREVPVPGGAGGTVELPLVDEIVLARTDELLERAGAAIEELCEGRPPAAGVVLTGGGVALRGFPKRAMEVWGWPVRLGAPAAGDDRFPAAASPAAATAVGLIACAERSPALLAGGAIQERTGVVAASRRLVAWLSGLV